ncbi:MAG: DUF4860 domain-containing protein [Oscillospiraceae bacterium]
MIDLLFILALFCVLAISSLMVVMIGANVYKSTVEQSNLNFNLNTSLSYVSEKIRQNDLDDSISIGKIEDTQALVLKQDINGTTYQTLIYYSDGYLRELFAAQGTELSCASGQPLIELDGFNIKQGNGYYSFTSISDGVSRQLIVSPRCN